MRKNQFGVGAAGGIIVLLIIGVIGIAGWLVYGHQSTNNADTPRQPKLAVQTINETDTAKTFSYSYPSNWSLQKYTWSDCCEGPAHPEPDWTKQIQPITLKEKSSPLDAAIRIDDFGPNAIDREYSGRTVDKFNTYARLKLNGYDALHHVTDFVGPSAAEKYKDDEYIISTGSKSVRLQFRERYSNSTINGENDFNASVLLPDFEQVARSVRFLGT